MASYDAITLEQAYTRRPSPSFAVIGIGSPLLAKPLPAMQKKEKTKREDRR